MIRAQRYVHCIALDGGDGVGDNLDVSQDIQTSDFWRVINALADEGFIRVSQRQSGDNPEIRRIG